MHSRRRQRTQQLVTSPLVSWMYGPVASIIVARSPSGSGSWFRKRTPHKTNVDTPPVERCSCRAFKLADHYWTAHRDQMRIIWNPAVKMQPLSGYKLWMKEAVSCLNRFGVFPLEPSPSGGFSLTSIIPGTETPTDDWFAEHCIKSWYCIDGTCVEGEVSADGQSRADCVETCEPPPTRYDCIDHACVEAEGGVFATLEECQAVCTPPPPQRYTCDNGLCLPAEDGEHENLAACLAQCEPLCFPDCHDCEPLMPCSIKVTLAGGTGFHEAMNGDHRIDWIAECDWSTEDGLITLGYVGGDRWRVYIPAPAGVATYHLAPGPDCDPTGTYVLIDDGCDDPPEDCPTPPTVTVTFY